MPPKPVTLSPAAQAHQALESGLWGLADRLAGTATDANPRDASAWNIRGRLALSAGRPDLARQWFARAVEADPSFKPAAKNLRTAQSLPDAPPPPAGSCLLILPWGQGFFSDVDMTLGGLLAAEICARTPIVHWGIGSLFRDPATANAWPVYAEPIGDISQLPPGPIFHPRYTAANLGDGPQHRFIGPGAFTTAFHHFPRPEPLCIHDFHTGIVNLLDWLPQGHRLQGATVAAAYRDLVTRYFRPSASITALADAFEREALRARPGPILAVHARGSDKAIEDPAIARAHASYPARIDEFLAADPRARVFLLTDSVPLLADFSRRYDDRVITTPATRTAGEQGVHLLASPSRESLGREVLLDALLAARCDAFLGYGMSNVSCFVRALKDWPADRCHLVGRVMFEERK